MPLLFPEDFYIEMKEIDPEKVPTQAEARTRARSARTEPHRARGLCTGMAHHSQGNEQHGGTEENQGKNPGEKVKRESARFF